MGAGNPDRTPAMLRDMRKSKIYGAMTKSANFDIHEIIGEEEVRAWLPRAALAAAADARASSCRAVRSQRACARGWSAAGSPGRPARPSKPHRLPPAADRSPLCRTSTTCTSTPSSLTRRPSCRSSTCRCEEGRQAGQGVQGVQGASTRPAATGRRRPAQAQALGFWRWGLNQS